MTREFEIPCGRFQSLDEWPDFGPGEALAGRLDWLLPFCLNLYE
jgi:hypothetical protein